MNGNGFHASTSGGKKVIAVSLVLALVLASISVVAAFAAPRTAGGTTSGSGNSGSQMRELNFARAWYNSARLDAANFARTSDPVKAQQWLDQYAFALRQAEAVAVGRGTNAANSNGSNADGSAQQQLGQYLHTMRGLRDKLASIGFSANMANSNNNMAGAGVPVTGGNSSSGTSSSSSTGAGAAAATATPSTGTGSSSSSGTGSAATATATPGTGTGSSAATATPSTGTGSSSSSGTSSSSSTGNAGIPNTGNNQSTNFLSANRRTLMKTWGPQFSELESALAWYNNYRSNPRNFLGSSDPARTQQWLDQYAFALRQAQALLVNGGANTANSSNSSSGSSVNGNNSSNSSAGFGSAQQQLGQWLHMMRGLRDKLTSGTNGINSSSSSSTGGSTTP